MLPSVGTTSRIVQELTNLVAGRTRAERMGSFSMSTDEDAQQRGGSSMDEVADQEENKGEGAPGNESDPVESLRKELQYALAEIANIRTRSAKDRSEMMKYG